MRHHELMEERHGDVVAFILARTAGHNDGPAFALRMLTHDLTSWVHIDPQARCDMLTNIAEAYRDHPDFDPAWRRTIPPEDVSDWVREKMAQDDWTRGHWLRMRATE